MNTNRWVLLITALLLIGGCGRGSGPPQIIIGCPAPLTGDQAQIGIDVCRSVGMAIEEANAKDDVIPGTALKLSSLDDQHNPSQAVSVAKRYVSDRDVMGVIGHFNSSCTKPASAIYHEAGMVEITAASTNPELSRQGFDTFFRVAATDEVQGPSGARYAAHALAAKTVFIIDDKTTYGKGLADHFEKEAEALGLAVLGHEGITQGDKDFTPLLTKIKPINPDLIYFGGIYPEGALLVRQMRALNMPAVLMGGDGLASAVFTELASPAIAQGTYATMVGGDIKQIRGAAAFVGEYERRYAQIGQWSAYGYDSANILIAAIRKAGKKDRGAVLKAMREIPVFAGITGNVVFDKNGDNQNQSIGMFKFENGELVYVGPAR